MPIAFTNIIDKKGYAEKYKLDGRPVVKVGVNFSGQERNISEWLSEVEK